MKQKEITFEDLVIAAERATRKAAAIDAAKKAMSGIAWAEPDVIKAVVLLDKPDRREGRRARQCHATAGAAISHISRPN